MITTTTTPQAPTDVDSWVEAAPFRAHLRHLMAAGGLSCGSAALLTGVSPRLAVTLLYGRGGRPLRRISPDTARQLLSVTTAEARSVRRRSVPATATREHLRRLQAAGWCDPELAGLLGVALEEVVGLLSGRVRTCRQLTALRAHAEVGLLLDPSTTVGTRVRAAA